MPYHRSRSRSPPWSRVTWCVTRYYDCVACRVPHQPDRDHTPDHRSRSRSRSPPWSRSVLERVIANVIVPLTGTSSPWIVDFARHALSRYRRSHILWSDIRCCLTVDWTWSEQVWDWRCQPFSNSDISEERSVLIQQISLVASPQHSYNQHQIINCTGDSAHTIWARLRWSWNWDNHDTLIGTDIYTMCVIRGMRVVSLSLNALFARLISFFEINHKWKFNVNLFGPAGRMSHQNWFVEE